MITFLFYVLLLWLAWRLVCRWMASQDVLIAPPSPPSITINVYVKELHVERVERRIDHT